jgi:hypothetical protein
MSKRQKYEQNAREYIKKYPMKQTTRITIDKIPHTIPLYYCETLYCPLCEKETEFKLNSETKHLECTECLSERNRINETKRPVTHEDRSVAVKHFFPETSIRKLNNQKYNLNLDKDFYEDID